MSLLHRKFVRNPHNYPHQKAAAIKQYSPIKATPSSHIDSPSKTINALTITDKAKQASSIGVSTKDKIAPPKKKESSTSSGNNASAIWRELFNITLIA